MPSDDKVTSRKYTREQHAAAVPQHMGHKAQNTKHGKP